jgi:hypothetical protein
MSLGARTPAPAPAAPPSAASPAPSPNQTFHRLRSETKVLRWLLRLIRLNHSERPQNPIFPPYLAELGQFGSGNQELEFLGGSQLRRIIKKARERKSADRRGSNPRSGIRGGDGEGFGEVKVEEIYAAGRFGREVVWEGEKKLMGNTGGLVGLSQIFESQVLYSVYFPFSEQFFESLSLMLNLLALPPRKSKTHRSAVQINADGNHKLSPRFSSFLSPQ